MQLAKHPGAVGRRLGPPQLHALVAGWLVRQGCAGASCALVGYDMQLTETSSSMPGTHHHCRRPHTGPGSGIELGGHCSPQGQALPEAVLAQGKGSTGAQDGCVDSSAAKAQPNPQRYQVGRRQGGGGAGAVHV